MPLSVVIYIVFEDLGRKVSGRSIWAGVWSESKLDLLNRLNYVLWNRFSTSGCPDALDAYYVASWQLPRPDLHRLADDDFAGHTIDLLAPHQSFPYPTRVAAAIKDSKNHSLVVNDSIIYGEWESLGELAVVSKNELVNAAEVC